MKYSLRSLMLVTGAVAVVLGVWVNWNAVSWQVPTLSFACVLIVTVALLKKFLYWASARLHRRDDETP